MMEAAYIRQVELLLDVLPEIAREKHFALKGGTAINLFCRNLPRLSVDIDLTYLPLEDRQTSLRKMSESLQSTARRISSLMPDVRTIHKLGSSSVGKLLIERNGISIVVEPNEIMRGALYPAVERSLCFAAQDRFMRAVKSQTLSLEELYAGKICAALDRQHPRDLFDIKLLLDEEGFSSKIRQAFVVYLAAHSRSMSDLLKPNLKDIKKVFHESFMGLTDVSVRLEELLHIRDALLSKIHADLTEEERQFLISIKSGKPRWELLPFEHLSKLPAIQWKLLNVGLMNKAKRETSIRKLRKILFP